LECADVLVLYFRDLFPRLPCPLELELLCFLRPLLLERFADLALLPLFAEGYFALDYFFVEYFRVAVLSPFLLVLPP
jgi:hypothetical protein